MRAIHDKLAIAIDIEQARVEESGVAKSLEPGLPIDREDMRPLHDVGEDDCRGRQAQRPLAFSVDRAAAAKDDISVRSRSFLRWVGRTTHLLRTLARSIYRLFIYTTCNIILVLFDQIFHSRHPGEINLQELLGRHMN
jgi:hypothetical protein